VKDPDGDEIRATIRTSIVPAVGSMFKWSLASLLTINGGAVLAILQADKENFTLVRAAGSTFGIGIGGAIIAGMAAAIIMIVALSTLTDPKSQSIGTGGTLTILFCAFIVVLGAGGSLACFFVGLAQLNASIANAPSPTTAIAPVQSAEPVRISITIGSSTKKVGIPTAE
jgi:hypothetical protein